MTFILKFCGKKSLAILLAISFLILLLDLIGIALIFPFLNLFIEPHSALKNEYINAVYQALGFQVVNDFVYFVGFILIFAYILKLIVKTISGAITYHIYADLIYRLSQFLFKGLLNAKYSLFTEQGASEMITTVNTQAVYSVICLESLVKIVNEITFLTVLLVIMFFVNPSITILAVILFISLGAILYFGLIKKIEAFGKIHSRLNILVYKYGNAMANSIKDIKIMRLEKNYISKLSEIWHEYTHNDSKSKVFKGIPADLSETIIFTGIISVCIYLLFTEQVAKDIIPLLGVLAVSAMRLLPSFNRITGSYNQYRFYKPSLALIDGLVDKIKRNRQNVEHLELPFTHSFEAKNLSFQHAEKIILDNLSFTIKKGKSYAFVGASGAGKSTLLDILVGLRESSNGEFFLDGAKFDPFSSDALRNYIGYVPQDVNLIDESIAFNIAFEKNYVQKKMQRAISIACLENFVSQLPIGLDTILGESGVRLSGGQKQRVGIARALYRDPEILIFDEATSALDNITERELMEELNKLSGEKTLIIVAHRLSTVETCDVINFLDNGRIIAQGTHAELLKNSIEYQILYNQQAQE